MYDTYEYLLCYMITSMLLHPQKKEKEMPNDRYIEAALASYFAIIAVVTIAAIVFNIIVYWRICSKAGYSGAMSLLIFVPFGSLIMLCILAFGDWPALRGLNQLQATPVNQFAGQSPYQQPAQQYAQPGQYSGQGQYPQQGQYSQPGQYPQQGYGNNDPRYQ